MIDPSNKHVKIIDYSDAKYTQSSKSSDFKGLYDTFHDYWDRSDDCWKLLESLISKKPKLNKYGLESIKKHKCFINIDWQKLYNGEDSIASSSSASAPPRY
uniref:Uncharacterized protein n=1 Tax=Ditylenchus dipsaci TaxID=166011 RepID=A0A915DMP3_9BILA